MVIEDYSSAKIRELLDNNRERTLDLLIEKTEKNRLILIMNLVREFGGKLLSTSSRTK